MARGESRPVNWSVEVFFPIGKVARRIGWSRNRTKRWAVAFGVKRTTGTGRWYLTRANIRMCWPEDADYIIAGLCEE